MKKSKVEAAETRRRILKAARQEFCRNGIQATGLSELMAAAGLTHGGFYKHFRSKDQVVAEALASGLCAFVNETEASPVPPGKKGLAAIVESYLSIEHRDDPAHGCPLAALGGELVHTDGSIRESASRGFTELVDHIAKQFPRTKPEVAKARALFILSAMVGALTMARMVTDPALSAAILDQAKKSLVAS